MRIDRFQIESYQSFSLSGWIKLEPGTNLIVGQNNSGKSAVIRALSPDFTSSPHRDLDEHRLAHLSPSMIEIEASVAGREIEDAWIEENISVEWPIVEPGEEALVSFRPYLDTPKRKLKLKRNSSAIESGTQPSNGIFVGSSNWSVTVWPQAGKLKAGGYREAGQDNFAQVLTAVWRRGVFFFDAQRFGIGKSGHEYAKRLSPNAQNLPAVLHRMQGEQGDLFDRLVDHIREIFSTIGNLSVAPAPDNSLEVRVWPTRERRIVDLSVGLSDCGTGVSQAISILTVAMTIENAVIIVDEISSFLHPAAAKALVRILQTHYAKHQYILTTHSPEVLSISNTATVHFVTKAGYSSSIAAVNLNQLEDLEEVAGQLGISPTDVFASERIIWVEGQTEQLCFPYLFNETRAAFETKHKSFQFSPFFVAVVATGDFLTKGRRADLIFDIYNRLVSTTATLVKSVTFGFDLEELPPEKSADLIRRAKGRLLLLPRRMLECYLLDPDAIASIVNRSLGESRVSSKDVLELIIAWASDGHGDQKAKRAWSGDVASDDWLKVVDAAKLLDHLFSELSGKQLKYHKKQHGLELLKEISSFKPSGISGLVDYVHSLVALSAT